MSIKTIYKCDKCGEEQYTDSQFWSIGVSANTVGLTASTYFVEGKSMQVCRPCLESLGINVRKKDSDVKPEYPSLESLILEIMQRCQE